VRKIFWSPAALVVATILPSACADRDAADRPEDATVSETGDERAPVSSAEPSGAGIEGEPADLDDTKDTEDDLAEKAEDNREDARESGVEDAVDDAADVADDAGEDASEAARDAGRAVGDAAEDVGDAAEDAVD